MAEESTTADPVERWRQAIEALNRRDFDALMSFFSPQAVWDAAAAMGRFEGPVAIRRHLEDWIGSFDDYEAQFEVQYVGNGVLFVVATLGGRPAHGAGRVQERRALTSTWAAGVIVQVTARTEIDEARAAAERLAEERADVDLRRGYEVLSAGDLDEALRLLAHDAVVDMTRTVGVVVHGRDAFHAFQEDWSAGYEEVTYTPEEIINVGNGVTFVRVLQIARPKGTGAQVTQREPNVFITEDGRVVRIIIYPESELDEARAAAERLAEERG